MYDTRFTFNSLQESQRLHELEEGTPTHTYYDNDPWGRAGAPPPPSTPPLGPIPWWQTEAGRAKAGWKESEHS
jgi:hypothetical protein